MKDEELGTKEAFVSAFETLRREGLSQKHIDLLVAHYRSPHHTVTWDRLAEEVGYKNAEGVKLQYGGLAKRVGTLLGFTEPPIFWLHAVADWGGKDPVTGHQEFVLRPVVIQALREIGILPAR